MPSRLSLLTLSLGAAILAAVTLAGCASAPPAPGTMAESYKLKDGTVLRYMEYVPAKIDLNKHVPIMIFLHGSGSAGLDINAVLDNGPWQYAREHADFPFIILAPQLDQDGEWDPEKLNEWLEHVVGVLPVDRRRIYLTGLSRGGQGAWDFAMRYPHWFAAVAPLSGYSDIRQPCRLQGMPVWAFHGAQDGIVPIKYDQATVAEAQGCGVKVKFTVYPDLGHDTWTRTYEDPALYAWLRSARKPLFRLSPPLHMPLRPLKAPSDVH